jgi:excisionase family DNA binding protein
MPFDYKPQNSYTPMEVAELMGVKPSTVYAWLSRKELMGNKVGHKRYITEQQLKRFYEQRMNNVIIDYT